MWSCTCSDPRCANSTIWKGCGRKTRRRQRSERPADANRLRRMESARRARKSARAGKCTPEDTARPETAFMRLVVVSIGRLKQGPEQELAERYRERFEDIGRKLGFR